MYGIPSNADSVLKVDPTTGEVTEMCKGQLPEGQNKWYGGIRGPDGAIYGIPYNAECVLRIIPETQSVELVGELPKVGAAQA